jgi:hypothetical protein
MKQNIDFFPSLSTESVKLPSKWITISVAASMVLIMLLSLTTLLNQIRYYFELKQVHADNIQATALFYKIAKSYPLLATDTPLGVHLGLLEEALKEQEKQYADLTRSKLRYGFSNYMKTLAQIVPEGVWLKTISIHQEKKTALLIGDMVKPVDVSILLDALQTAPTFSDTVFNVFYIKGVPGKTNIEFKVTNASLNIVTPQVVSPPQVTSPPQVVSPSETRDLPK